MACHSLVESKSLQTISFCLTACFVFISEWQYAFNISNLVKIQLVRLYIYIKSKAQESLVA